MELNFDCMRDVLLYFRENLKLNTDQNDPKIKSFNMINSTNLYNIPELEYSSDDICYSIFNLVECGFLQGYSKGGDKVILYAIENITFAGHQFLNNIQEPTVWNKTKQILRKLGGASLTVIGQVAKEILIRSLQDPSVWT